MLVDSNVLIDFIKNKSEAIRFVESESLLGLSTSIIVLIEIFIGARNLLESKKIEKTLTSLNLKIYHLNTPISKVAFSYLRETSLKNAIGIYDYLIAATAKFYNQPIATLNTKHFKHIDELKIVRSY